jgi:hypothetical protein
LQARLPFFGDLDAADTNLWVHRKSDNLEAFIDRSGPVKVAFFGGLDTLRRVQDPRRAVDSRVRVASFPRSGRHENACNPNARKLEGLRGHSCAGVPRDQPANGFGSGQSD